jgi:hypothetical protein
MEQILGTTLGDFVFITLVLGGGAAWMTGQSTAIAWNPAVKLAPFALMIAAACRFLHYALFDGDLLSFGFVFDLAWVYLVAWVAYAATRAARMVRQYPWLYERAGLFGWRTRDG